jgi:pyruvate/2-oxoglutarate/acetoin dehydrogenase E1 component
VKVLEALNHGLRNTLEADQRVHFLGEDILDPYGGAFKVAAGLSTAFPDRVHTTPVSEAGIVGAGVGMALRGLLPVVEIMFGDFITLAADQLINHAGKLRWMSADRVRVPLVVRTPMGGRRGYGPTHSQTLERLFLGVPGLRVIAAPALDDPGRLLRAAVLEDGDPVLFIEHKLLYGLPVQPSADTPEWEIAVGSGRYPSYRLRVQGAPIPQATLVGYGYMASLAQRAVRQLAYQHECFVELVVLTQLSPFDLSAVHESVAATGRLLTVEEGVRTHGWGAEVVAAASEGHGGRLAAARIGAADLPVPSAGPLEAAVLPSEQDIVVATLALVGRRDVGNDHRAHEAAEMDWESHA